MAALPAVVSPTKYRVPSASKAISPLPAAGGVIPGKVIGIAVVAAVAVLIVYRLLTELGIPYNTPVVG